MSSDFDRQMMGLALKLGQRGRPSPEPHAGAVIVRDGQVIATGYRHRAGDAQAELDALARIDHRAQGATLYVTLEPCSQPGPTGVSTEAIVRAGVARVVVGCERRGPGQGGGAEALRRQGVEVALGVCRTQAEALVADFFKVVEQGLPFVTLKAAVTLDGKMAARSGDSRWITGGEARTHAHRMRDRSDAIMVGVGTVLADDPALTVRHVKGQDPIRVILDTHLLTSPEARVLRAGSKAATWIFHGPSAAGARRDALQQAGARLHEAPAAAGRLDLRAVLRHLAGQGVVRLLVEGGPSLHGALLDAGLVDWAAIFMAPRILGDAGALPLALGRPRERMAEAIALRAPSLRRLGDDILIEGPVQVPEVA